MTNLPVVLESNFVHLPNYSTWILLKAQINYYNDKAIYQLAEDNYYKLLKCFNCHFNVL